jgi:hypothetical protein
MSAYNWVGTTVTSWELKSSINVSNGKILKNVPQWHETCDSKRSIRPVWHCKNLRDEGTSMACRLSMAVFDPMNMIQITVFPSLAMILDQHSSSGRQNRMIT